ncbi:MAG: TAT-variant-translocated molybdopterin oxidoreductase [Planctomycetes bacterium]|nr:TAT-variant-translocated molybdopterin oxidoreductase [Planctomycetota bacterium]
MAIENQKSKIENTPDLTGQAYWRSLEEYADSPAFRQAVAEEFPGYDPDEILSMSRRKFMALAGASMALAGLTLTGCRRWPKEQVLPYAARPDGHMPGVPEYYASITERGGVATPVLVKTFDGRPIKIDGNPGNPEAGGSGQTPYLKGKTSVFDQAETLTFYDPERARGVMHNGEESTWQAFRSFVKGHPAFQQGGADQGLAVLAESSSSPTAARLRKELSQKYPGAKWYTYDAVSRDHEIEGAKLAFGQPARAIYDLSKADVIVALDCDLLTARHDSPRLAHDWSLGRKSADTAGQMNRLYAIESTFTTTGSVADHRLPVKASKVGEAANILMGMIDGSFQPTVVLGRRSRPNSPALNAAVQAAFEMKFQPIADDLKNHLGKAVVIPGESQPAEVHALCHAINQQIGAAASGIVRLVEEPLAEETTGIAAITELTQRMNADEIDTLLILGGNPVYDAPADIDFAAALKKVPHAIRLSLYHDETSALCEWQLPAAHALEAWGDGRAWDGVVSIQQPTIKPLFEDAQRTTGGRTAAEVLAIVLGSPYQDSYSLTRQTHSDLDEKAWRQALHDGVIAASDARLLDLEARLPQTDPESGIDGFEVTIGPDPSLYDGRYANNGWMQEAPKPLSKITWDNVATISITDAQQFGVQNGDHLKITVAGNAVELPAYIMPGQPTGSVALTLGYGRTRAGHVGNGVGVNTYTLRTTKAPAIAPAGVEKTNGFTKLATTTVHHLIDPDLVNGKNRGTDTPAAWGLKKRVGEPGKSGYIIHEANLEKYKKAGSRAFKEPHADLKLQLFPGPDEAPNPRNPEGPTAFNDPHAWGMAIDMNSCIGCNACVVACQAENNVPVTGKAMVNQSREMHWLRIDTYFKGEPDSGDVQAVHQPMMCVHCENAPCEQVCPVAATVHDSEGLNTMVYNRCIGTRYCSNNCPYKVRRFNYYDYHAKDVRGGISAKPWLNIPDTQQQGAIDQITRMVFNPDVTVRMRGVMEKCTYCTQRIAAAKINAKNEWAKTKQGIAGYDREQPHVTDGEVTTACQDACATNAIVFGDLNDPQSKVFKLHQNNRAYGVLDLLNTRPRTKHLAKIRNPKT